ncbi:MAG: hypothetical protein HYR96_09625 [Deltaproteobacteria bacterium]|nr:hypothetical protein [Deltaproteobacteria bacterium]
MIKKCLSVLILSWAALVPAGLQADHLQPDYENVNLISCSFDLRPGESRTIHIPEGWRHVRKVYLTANSFYGDSTLQVYANDDEKGRIYVPKTDPYFVVNINETARAIVIRNTWGNGTARIARLRAELSTFIGEPIGQPIGEPGFTPVEPIHFPALNEAARFARGGITLIDRLRPFADPATEYITFLLPIKQVAGRTLALANAHGAGSLKVREALQALAQQIQFANDYIESSLKKEASFELAVELLSLKDKIKRWLD